MRPDVKDYRQGITSREAATRLLAYGPNELPERKPPGLLRIFSSSSVQCREIKATAYSANSDMYYIHSILSLLLVSFTSMAFGGETVTFSSEDGLLMTAEIHAPYKNGEAPVIVLFHQAGSSRGEYTDIAPWLNTLGYNCMAVDQRSGETAWGIDNETALRAEEENKPAGYISALPDIKAALAYARQHYGKDGVIAWGSSYSAALVLQVAGDSPGLVDAVLAFSPGEYFKRAGKSATWVQDAARHITVPVFITSSRNEADGWAAIFEGIESDQKASFIPATEGRHGSRALWKKYPDSEVYRSAVQGFLERNIPAR